MYSSDKFTCTVVTFLFFINKIFLNDINRFYIRNKHFLMFWKLINLEHNNLLECFVE